MRREEGDVYMDLEKLLRLAGLCEDLPGEDRLSELIAQLCDPAEDGELDESEMELVRAARGRTAARKEYKDEKDRR